MAKNSTNDKQSVPNESSASVHNAAADKSQSNGREAVFRHPDVVSALIRSVPATLGVLAFIGCMIAYREEVKLLIPNVGGVELLGLKVSLIDVRNWAEKANQDRKINVTDSELKAALDRAAATPESYQGCSVLWVDDVPENNVWERRALIALGCKLTVAISNSEALDLLRRNEFDVIISDLLRANEEKPQEVVAVAAKGGSPPAVIYYVANLDPTPLPNGVGATTRPDELINLITDVFERRRFQAVTKAR